MPQRRQPTATAVSPPPVSVHIIEQRILLVRGAKVMLDGDLAVLYGVPTKTLNQAVARNLKRFPSDFMFRLTLDEARALHISRAQIEAVTPGRLRSQSVTLKRGRHVKYAPWVFTEQGIAMLSSVLHSDRAIEVNIAIMRAFVHLRELLVTHADLARKIEELERKYDGQFATVFDAIRTLIMAPAADESPRRRIGFASARGEP